MASVMCCYNIPDGQVGIIERIHVGGGGKGRFSVSHSGIANPGPGCVPCYPCERLAGTVSFAVQELKIESHALTKDNHAVELSSEVRYQATREGAYDAFYSVADGGGDETKHVAELVRKALQEEAARYERGRIDGKRGVISIAIKDRIRKKLAIKGFYLVQFAVASVEAASPEASYDYENYKIVAHNVGEPPKRTVGSSETLLGGCCCLRYVGKKEVGIKENLEGFKDATGSGIKCVCWPFQTMDRLSLRDQQLDMIFESKTKDDVDVGVAVAVTFRAVPERLYDAYYRTADPPTLIQSNVVDVIDRVVPRMDSEAALRTRRQSVVADRILERLKEKMLPLGYEILDCAVKSISARKRSESIISIDKSTLRNVPLNVSKLAPMGAVMRR